MDNWKFDFATRMLLEGHARKFGVKEENIDAFIEQLEKDILIPKDIRQEIEVYDANKIAPA